MKREYEVKDPVVDRVLKKFTDRSNLGFEKHKKEFLQFFGAETPDASRNRYWNQWLVGIRSRAGPGNPPIFAGPTGRRPARGNRPARKKSRHAPGSNPREITKKIIQISISAKSPQTTNIFRAGEIAGAEPEDV